MQNVQCAHNINALQFSAQNSLEAISVKNQRLCNDQNENFTMEEFDMHLPIVVMDQTSNQMCMRI